MFTSEEPTRFGIGCLGRLELDGVNTCVHTLIIHVSHALKQVVGVYLQTYSRMILQIHMAGRQ